MTTTKIHRTGNCDDQKQNNEPTNPHEDFKQQHFVFLIVLFTLLESVVAQLFPIGAIRLDLLLQYLFKSLIGTFRGLLIADIHFSPVEENFDWVFLGFAFDFRMQFKNDVCGIFRKRLAVDGIRLFNVVLAIHNYDIFLLHAGSTCQVEGRHERHQRRIMARVEESLRFKFAVSYFTV